MFWNLSLPFLNLPPQLPPTFLPAVLRLVWINRGRSWAEPGDEWDHSCHSLVLGRSWAEGKEQLLGLEHRSPAALSLLSLMHVGCGAAGHTAKPSMPVWGRGIGSSDVPEEQTAGAIHPSQSHGWLQWLFLLHPGYEQGLLSVHVVYRWRFPSHRALPPLMRSQETWNEAELWKWQLPWAKESWEFGETVRFVLS